MLFALAVAALIATIAAHPHHDGAPNFPGYIVTGKVTGHSGASPQWGYAIARQTTSCVYFGCVFFFFSQSKRNLIRQHGSYVPKQEVILDTLLPVQTGAAPNPTYTGTS
jgi:hypothetical protein